MTGLPGTKMMCPIIQLTEWTFLLLMYVSAGVSELICPSVGYLGSPAYLTCISPSSVTSYAYTASQGEGAAICNASGSSCTTLGNYRASTINQTHSILTIHAVQPAHAGEWRCYTSPCNLIVVKLPVCSMSHHVTDPDTVEGVSPGVNIRGYYCSELAQLKISTGDNVIEYPDETVTNITDRTVHINKTDASLGTEVIFTCGHHRWNISCNLDNREVLEDKATSNRTSTAVIIGSVVAGIVIVTIIITFVVVLMKMIRSKLTQQPDNHVYDSIDDVARETNDTSGHEYNAYLTALERDTSYYNVISN